MLALWHGHQTLPFGKDWDTAWPLAPYRLCGLAELEKGRSCCDLSMGLFTLQTHYLNPRAQVGEARLWPHREVRRGRQGVSTEQSEVAWGQGPVRLARRCLPSTTSSKPG